MQYRPHRYITEFPTTVHTPWGPKKAHIIDVNNVGARLKGLRGMQRGQKLRLKALHTTIDGIVQWAGPDCIGISFRPQINDDQVDMLRFRKGGRAGRRPSTVGFRFAEMR